MNFLNYVFKILGESSINLECVSRHFFKIEGEKNSGKKKLRGFNGIEPYQSNLYRNVWDIKITGD